jgi:hypothetical protein
VVSVECPHGGRVGKWESGLLLDPAAVAVECDVPRQDSAIGVPFSARHQLGIASPFSGFALRPSAAASGSRCEKLVRAWENEIVGERVEESAGEGSYAQSKQLFRVDFRILLEMTSPHPRLLRTV